MLSPEITFTLDIRELKIQISLPLREAMPLLQMIPRANADYADDDETLYT